MSIMYQQQFQCAATICLSYSTTIVTNILHCQANCLAQIQCKAASFHQLNSICQLFDKTPTSSPTLEEDVDTVAMMIISRIDISTGMYQIMILHST